MEHFKLENFMMYNLYLNRDFTIETTSNYFLMIFMLMEFDSSLAGWPWHSVLWYCNQNVIWDGSNLKPYQARRCISNVAIIWLLAGGLLYVSTLGSSSIFIIWQMASPKQMIQKKKAGTTKFPYELASDVIHCHFYKVWRKWNTPILLVGM